MIWIYFWSVDGVEKETSLESSLLTVMATWNDVEIGNSLFGAVVHQLGKSQIVAKNPASSREETEIDISHDFCLMVMMTWTDDEIGTRTQNSENGMWCAGADQ